MGTKKFDFRFQQEYLATGHELERARLDRLATRSDADHARDTPPAVCALESGAHDSRVAGAERFGKGGVVGVPRSDSNRTGGAAYQSKV